MNTEPFCPLLAAVLAGVLAGAGPALADGHPNGEGPAPAADVQPKIVQPQPKPDKPAPPALNGLHLKLGNVELKVRGPVIIDAGPGDTGSQQGK